MFHHGNPSCRNPQSQPNPTPPTRGKGDSDSLDVNQRQSFMVQNRPGAVGYDASTTSRLRGFQISDFACVTFQVSSLRSIKYLCRHPNGFYLDHQRKFKFPNFWYTNFVYSESRVVVESRVAELVLLAWRANHDETCTALWPAYVEACGGHRWCFVRHKRSTEDVSSPCGVAKWASWMSVDSRFLQSPRFEDCGSTSLWAKVAKISHCKPSDLGQS